MRDEEMIRQIRQGRTELLDPLIDRYYQDIFRAASGTEGPLAEENG